MNRSSEIQIMISGWYGNSNLGDEAQLSAMIRMIKARVPGSVITVLSDNEEATVLEHKVNALNRHGLKGTLRLLRALLHSDLFILGGGTLLYDIDAGAGTIIRRLNDIIAAKCLSTRVIYFNGGIGMIYNSISKYYMRHVANSIDLITVRDQKSKAVLSSLGISRPVHVTADSFLYGKGKNPAVKKSFRNTDSVSLRVGINLRPWLYPSESLPAGGRSMCGAYGGSSEAFIRFRKNLAQLCDYLKISHGAEIEFFPISFFRDKFDDDIGLANEVSNLMRDAHRVRIVQAECSRDALLRKIQEYDFIIGMRLHALEFAASTATPMIAINYDSKTDAFMHVIGQQHYAINIAETELPVLIEKVERLLKNRIIISADIADRLPTLSANAFKASTLMEGLLATKKCAKKLMFQGFVLTLFVLPCQLLLMSQIVIRVFKRVSPLPFWLKLSKIFRAVSNRLLLSR